MIYSRIMLVWQSRSSFISFVQKQRLSTQVIELHLKKYIILYVVLSFEENLCEGLFCLRFGRICRQPCLCEPCATGCGSFCGAGAQGGDSDVCTLAQLPLCSWCRFSPLLMPELCSVLGIGSRVSGKGHPEAPPLPLCPFLSLWSLTTSKEQRLTFAFGFIQEKWICSTFL